MLFVDDGSTDRTAEVLMRVRAALPSKVCARRAVGTVSRHKLRRRAEEYGCWGKRAGSHSKGDVLSQWPHGRSCARERTSTPLIAQRRAPALQRPSLARPVSFLRHGSSFRSRVERLTRHVPPFYSHRLTSCSSPATAARPRRSARGWRAAAAPAPPPPPRTPPPEQPARPAAAGGAPAAGGGPKRPPCATHSGRASPPGLPAAGPRVRRRRLRRHRWLLGRRSRHPALGADPRLSPPARTFDCPILPPFSSARERPRDRSLHHAPGTGDQAVPGRFRGAAPPRDGHGRPRRPPRARGEAQGAHPLRPRASPPISSSALRLAFPYSPRPFRRPRPALARRLG